MRHERIGIANGIRKLYNHISGKETVYYWIGELPRATYYMSWPEKEVFAVRPYEDERMPHLRDVLLFLSIVSVVGIASLPLPYTAAKTLAVIFAILLGAVARVIVTRTEKKRRREFIKRGTKIGTPGPDGKVDTPLEPGEKGWRILQRSLSERIRTEGAWTFAKVLLFIADLICVITIGGLAIVLLPVTAYGAFSVVGLRKKEKLSILKELMRSAKEGQNAGRDQDHRASDRESRTEPVAAEKDV